MKRNIIFLIFLFITSFIFSQNNYEIKSVVELKNIYGFMKQTSGVAKKEEEIIHSYIDSSYNYVACIMNTKKIEFSADSEDYILFTFHTCTPADKDFAYLFRKQDWGIQVESNKSKYILKSISQVYDYGDTYLKLPDIQKIDRVYKIKDTRRNDFEIFIKIADEEAHFLIPDTMYYQYEKELPPGYLSIGNTVNNDFYFFTSKDDFSDFFNLSFLACSTTIEMVDYEPLIDCMNMSHIDVINKFGIPKLITTSDISSLSSNTKNRFTNDLIFMYNDFELILDNQGLPSYDSNKELYGLEGFLRLCGFVFYDQPDNYIIPYNLSFKDNLTSIIEKFGSPDEFSKDTLKYKFPVSYEKITNRIGYKSFTKIEAVDEIEIFFVNNSIGYIEIIRKHNFIES